MNKQMDKWFFMRPGFTRFRLEPDTDPEYLFGASDRRRRDNLLGAIEEACYSKDGHKAAIYGDYGLGKTHQCKNIIYEIKRQNLPIKPVYIKCGAYGTKDPFHKLFGEMVLQHRTEELQNIAIEYQRMVQKGQASPLLEVVHSEEVHRVLSRGLTAVELDEVRNSMRWLGGEAKVEMGLISRSLPPQLKESQEFGAVMRGLAHMYQAVEGKVLLYLIDEAERFQNITQPDAFFSWAASIRELTEITGVGLIFLIGAKTRNELPVIFVQDEIVRRIGVTNYVELMNPGRDDLEGFVVELLQTVILKGEVPKAHQDVVNKQALDSKVPDELRALTEDDPERLRAYPFEVDALSDFIEQVTSGDLASKPSEVLIRLQKAAQRAMRLDARTIDAKLVSDINAEGF
ncbi:hypothetical protein [Archangium sp.]|uniref:hypothetical protein n=1 Tax=Archangium sp. TaxID=1872627 RepID=UPI002ED968F9